MPALSPTMDSGSIAVWRLKEGDSFAAGDSLCTIETDKAAVDFEAQDDGVLAKILVQPGVDVPIGTPICVVAEEAADVAAFAVYSPAVSDDSSAPAPAVSDSSTSSPSLISATPTAAAPTTPSLLLPSARHLAESNGKDATVLPGSAKGGRVTKGDVMAALKAGSLPDLNKLTMTTITTTTSTHPTLAAASTVASAPGPTTTAIPPTPSSITSPSASFIDLPIEGATSQSMTTNYQDVPNTKMRKIIATRLTASKRDVPHSYASMEVALDNIMALRKTLQKNHDVKVSVNDFIIRCCALSLRDVPEINATYDAKTGTVKRNHSIDVSVAVATPTGLITPIVFHTDTLGLAQITDTVRDLAGRARDGKLQPHEYQGGTFSISNLGMFGVAEFSAVINPPQAAILAVGGGIPTLLPGGGKSVLYDDSHATAADSPSASSKPVIQTIMTAQLSSDRRVVDEATASLFLQALRHYMQTPELLLL